MKVLIVETTLSGNGGAQRSTLAIGTHLAKRGHQLCLIYGAGGDLEPTWRATGAQMVAMGDVRLPRRRPLHAASTILRSLAAARRFRPDLVYCYSMDHVDIARAVARAHEAPIVLHLRTPVPRRTPRNVRRIRAATRFIAVSEASRREHDREFDLGELTVIHNGVDLEQFRLLTDAARSDARCELELGDDDIAIGYFGRLTQEKGVQDLVDACAILGLPEVTLFLVGAPQTDADEAYATALRRGPGRVVPLGYRTDVAKLMAAMDVVAVPSHVEPFGRTAVEAQACGTPVVATRVGGLPEVLGDEFGDLLAAPADPHDLARALTLAIAQARVTNRSRWRARAEQFDQRVTCERVETVLAETAAARSV